MTQATPSKLASCVEGLSALEELIGQLGPGVDASTTMQYVVDPATDQRLVQLRLGSATGMFVALRCKHALSAAHGLHVALLCSAWARTMNLAAEERSQIEVASLLHDVGVIGVPDRILNKPAQLESQEIGVVAHARRLGLEILRANGASLAVLEIVKDVPVWFNEPAKEDEPASSQTPLGSRMIAIAEAFDSMTTDHPFRSARSKERALDELVRCAGTQFDPILVEQFGKIVKHDLSQLYRGLASLWLQGLDPQTPQIGGSVEGAPPQEHHLHVMARFQTKILDHLRDAVLMVDAALNVIGWNDQAEQVTGIAAESITERPWGPEIVEMRDEEGRLVLDRRCPLQHAIATGMPSSGRLSLRSRNGGLVSVESQTIPILDQDGSLLGAAMIMRDVSSERSLEELCKDLSSKATVDPLTKVSNRAELERVLADLIQEYRRSSSFFSVIMCDLDHFKQINDTYGHQAGDEVLVKTGSVLQDLSRSHDLVARYGGEEFVILCPDCGIGPATRRAEKIRDTIGQTKHLLLSGRGVTASFGVTQVQTGDTAETILSRADRGLYLAKDQGRNRVIQLGAGPTEEEPARRWTFWRRRKPGSTETLAEDVLLAPGPLQVALEKLRGFAVDHRAVMKKCEENILEFEFIDSVYNARRQTDLTCVFTMTLKFSEAPSANGESLRRSSSKASYIRILAGVAWERASTGNDGELTDHARRTIKSLRAYLMAQRAEGERQDEEGQQGRKILLPNWTDQ